MWQIVHNYLELYDDISILENEYQLSFVKQ